MSRSSASFPSSSKSASHPASRAYVRYVSPASTTALQKSITGTALPIITSSEGVEPLCVFDLPVSRLECDANVLPVEKRHDETVARRPCHLHELLVESLFWGDRQPNVRQRRECRKEPLTTDSVEFVEFVTVLVHVRLNPL